jgi:hypothetical protein
MNELMHIPVWHFIVWTFGYAALGAAIGYGSGVLSRPSRRTFALRLVLEFGVAFVVAAGLVLGTALGFTLLSLLV